MRVGTTGEAGAARSLEGRSRHSARAQRDRPGFHRGVGLDLPRVDSARFGDAPHQRGELHGFQEGDRGL